ncbi:MAG: glycosyltransferase family 4 protein [Victivallaceae bacterium]|nr:glycosyltransferase family 4 protein [Victivallaceae bacterium]
MRILIVQPGIGNYRIDFFNALGRRAEVKVIYFFDNPGVHEEMFDRDLSPRLVDCATEKICGGFNAGAYPFRPRLWRTINSFKPDVVVAHEFNPVTLQLYLLRKLTGRRWKLFVWTSDTPEMVEHCRFMRRAARNFFCRAADGVMVYSNETAAAYLKFTAIKKDRLTVCPNVQSLSRLRAAAEAELEAAAKLRAELKIGEKKVFIFVGRLHPVKNLPGLIAAFNSAGVPGAVLLIVGDGAQRGELEALCSKLGATGKIFFLGRRCDRELMTCYAAADTLILPSFHETFGAVVNEALAVGLRAIVSRAAGARTLIAADRSNGVLFDPHSQSNLADAIAAEAGMVKRPPSGLRPALTSRDLPPFVDSFMDFCIEKNGGKS